MSGVSKYNMNLNESLKSNSQLIDLLKSIIDPETILTPTEQALINLILQYNARKRGELVKVKEVTI